MNNNMISLENKFKNLLSSKKITVREFCKKVGMSTTNLYDIYKRNSVDTKYLDKIMAIYKVPVLYFFSANDDLLTKKYDNVKVLQPLMTEKQTEYKIKKIYDADLEKLIKENLLLRNSLLISWSWGLFFLSVNY